MTTEKLIKLASHFEYKYAQYVTEEDPWSNYYRETSSLSGATPVSQPSKVTKVQPSQKQKDLTNLVNKTRVDVNTAVSTADPSIINTLNQMSSLLTRLFYKINNNLLNKNDITQISNYLNHAIRQNASETTKKKIQPETIVSLSNNIKSIMNLV